jgi:hypothetical protein
MKDPVSDQFREKIKFNNYKKKSFRAFAVC